MTFILAERAGLAREQAREEQQPQQQLKAWPQHCQRRRWQQRHWWQWQWHWHWRWQWHLHL